MLRLGLASLNAIAQGAKPKFKVKVYFQSPEEYMFDDYLQSVGSINSSLSSMGSYEIGNASVTLKNIDYYFSRKFARELPNNRRVEIFLVTDFEEALMWTGIVANFKSRPGSIDLDLNASLLGTINLRDTSVYKSPGAIETLKISVGDLSAGQIACTRIDKDGYFYHASDRRMQFINKVYVEGEPQTFGFTAYPAYVDETGNTIACVKFDNPQYEKHVSISGKGAFKLDTGELIENPADVIRWLFLDVQKADEASLDAGEIARFYSECLKAEKKVAFVLGPGTVKEFLDDLGLNIHAHWLISDGKSFMKLRDVASQDAAQHHFDEAEIGETLEVTSEELINEVTINYAYDFAAGEFRASITKHNPLSKLLFGVVVKKSFDLKEIQQTRQSEAVADGLLKTFSNPQLIASFRHNAKSIHLEVGDTCTITHRAGIGVNGFENTRAIISQKQMPAGADINYAVFIEQSTALYASELLSLTQVAGAGKENISIVAEGNGVYLITVCSDVAGSPGIPNAEVTISGVKKITDDKGQVRFNLQPGRYTAYIEASGYGPAEVLFSV